MRRREFVTSVVAGTLVAPVSAANQEHRHGGRMEGPLSNATVSFGAWPTNPPFDRLPPPPPGPPRNIHALIPHVVTIKQGGSVNFIVAGFHSIVVFAPGKRVREVNALDLIPVPGAPPDFPMLIDDDVKRVYRGPNPFGLPLDRTEIVHFDKRGLHLVICAFEPHFAEGMYGWVRVVR